MTSKRPMPPGRELLSKGNATAQRVIEQSRIMSWAATPRPCRRR